MSAKILPIDIIRRQIVVDEFGRLDAKVKEFKATKDRHEQLRKQILSWYEDLPAGEDMTVDAEYHSLYISPRERQRHIVSMRDLKNRLGLNRFLTLCKFPMNELDRIIVPAEQEGLVTTELDGPRRLRVTKKDFALEAAA